MQKTTLRVFCIIQVASFLLIHSPRVGFTQTSDEFKEVQKELQLIRKEIEALKEGQITLGQDHETIRLEIRRSDAVVLNYGDDPVKGNKDAKVTIIDFSDYG